LTVEKIAFYGLSQTQIPLPYLKHLQRWEVLTQCVQHSLLFDQAAFVYKDAITGCHHDDIVVKGASINSLRALTRKHRPVRRQVTEAGDCLTRFAGLSGRKFAR
jgi:hypothetical protein